MNVTDYLVLGLLLIGYGAWVGDWPPPVSDLLPRPGLLGLGLIFAAGLRLRGVRR